MAHQESGECNGPWDILDTGTKYRVTPSAVTCDFSSGDIPIVNEFAKR